MAQRRDMPPVPEELREESPRLYRFLLNIFQDAEDGLPPGFDETIEPSQVAFDQAADPGEGTAWADARHIHDLAAGSPVDLGDALADGTSSGAARADHVHKLLTRIAQNGSTIGTQRRVNLLDSSTLTWTVTDDAAGDGGAGEIDITPTVLLSGLTHNLLSATHPDTTPASPIRGDLIRGSSVPAWSRLAIGGAATFLRSDGTDPAWTAIAYSDLPATAQHWTRTGAIVHLTTVTDQVKIGGDSATVDGSLHLFCAAGTRHLTIADHGASANPLLRLRSSLGTETVPTATGSTNVLGRIEAQGYESGYATGGVIEFTAGQGWTGSAHGSRMILQLIPNGQTALRNALTATCVTGGGDDFEWVFNPPVGETLGASPSLRVYRNTDDANPTEVMRLGRTRSDSTAPVSGFGGELNLSLEAFTNNTLVLAARLRWIWEQTQTNDTTDRDAALSFWTMLDNTLSERLRITSAGVVQPAADATQDLGTSALRWNDLLVERVRAGVAGTASGILNSAASGPGAEVVHQLMEQASANAADMIVVGYNRARGTIGSESNSSAGDGIVQMRFRGYKGGTYEEGARISVDIEAVTNQLAGRITFWTKPDLSTMGTVITTRLQITSSGNVVVGNQASALATTATDGFFYIPGGAGPPTGTPSFLPTGTYPFYIDTTGAAGARLFAYYGGAWNAL